MERIQDNQLDEGPRMTLDALTYIVLTLATFRVTRFITTDFLFDPMRQWIWKKFPPETTKIGYLITCSWCSSFWVAAIIIAAYLLAPSITFVVSLVLSISSIVGYIAARVD